MRKSANILLGIPIVTGLATWVGAVYAWLGPPKPASVVTTTTVERHAGPVEDPLPFPAPGIGSPPGLQAGCCRMAAVAQGRIVAVTGRARVYDPVPGNLMAWRLQIYAGEGRRRQLKLLQEHDYADHAVTLAEGETVIVPTFADAFELPPGRYTLTLRLYIVAPGFPRGVPTEDLDRLEIAVVGSQARVVVEE